VHEMWQSANMAFALNATLVQGAAHALELFGSDAQKAQYLPKLVSGEWCGTMNITEPQAGSDMASIRARAIPEGDHYRISGQKIFISYGDHQMSENIVHLVLARTPDSPPGLKGLSLFVVLKVLEDGTRNDVHCVSLEHKLGIRGASTAVLSYGDNGGAVGTLVGELNRGVEYMFAMMNHARQAVGLQGLSIAERAYQQALSYARERVQGKPVGCSAPMPIVHHPDVRRMLMGMKARIEAMRGLIYTAAAAIDVAHAHTDEAARAKAHQLVELLTPMVKGWCTETGQSVASVGVQVHGGMGYIEETGAAQHLRDARITTIYEGTTAIQANDLLHRKVLRDGGKAIGALLDDVLASAEAMRTGTDASLRVVGGALKEAVGQAAQVVAWLMAAASNDARQPSAGAVPFLELMGIIVGGHCLAKAARAAVKQQSEQAETDLFLTAKPVLARFYAEHVLPQTLALAAAIMHGGESVMALDEAQL
jgi:3-(methylthio)propanoyl-CoA dehydrogenase